MCGVVRSYYFGACRSKAFIFLFSRTVWKDWPKKVIALYMKSKNNVLIVFLSSTGPVKPCVNLASLCAKAKYF